MSSNSTMPRDKFKVERISSTRSTNQLRPLYPPTLKVAQMHGNEGIHPKPKASSQSNTGDTRRSSSEVSADKSAAYLPVGRAWGNTAQGDCKSSAADHSPMSRWEHGAILGQPWNGVGEVAAASNGSKGSARRSQSKYCKSEKGSDCATKGSS